ncbi:MAG: extracellular solute-binding protein, partial [Anaerolineae bacterium]|nr:extracellular solute-binding protein [Anaerolineae bacterium]
GGTGAFDVTVNTFIWSGKWIGAGWCTDLVPLINDPELTDAEEFDVDDFVGGVIGTFRRGDSLYGIPWAGEATLMEYRTDVFEEHGISAPPDTFDEMLNVAEKIHSSEVAANLTRGTNGLNWVWPTYLFAYGGSFFRNPPDDMTPVLNSPEAVTSVEPFVRLSRDYGVPGSLSFGHGDTVTSFSQGSAAMWIDASGLLSGALDPEVSVVHDKVSFALPPAGPNGRTPQIAPHALMIPAATDDKRKGWEFIKWATSKEMQMRIALERNVASMPRGSVL